MATKKKSITKDREVRKDKELRKLDKLRKWIVSKKLPTDMGAFKTHIMMQTVRQKKLLLENVKLFLSLMKHRDPAIQSCYADGLSIAFKVFLIHCRSEEEFEKYMGGVLVTGRMFYTAIFFTHARIY